MKQSSILDRLVKMWFPNFRTKDYRDLMWFLLAMNLVTAFISGWKAGSSTTLGEMCLYYAVGAAAVLAGTFATVYAIALTIKMHTKA